MGWIGVARRDQGWPGGTKGGLEAQGWPGGGQGLLWGGGWLEWWYGDLRQILVCGFFFFFFFFFAFILIPHHSPFSLQVSDPNYLRLKSPIHSPLSSFLFSNNRSGAHVVFKHFRRSRSHRTRLFSIITTRIKKKPDLFTRWCNSF